MYKSHLYLVAAVLCAAVLLSCSAKSSVETTKQQNANVSAPGQGADGSAIVAETMGHFRVQTSSSLINIAKVYKNGVRLNDVIRFYSKVDKQNHLHLLLNIKPQAKRKGSAVLVEMLNNQLLSGSRLIPETREIVPISPQQKFSNVVIGGLSLLDFQMMQGFTPFAETRIARRDEVNGKLCDVIEVTPLDRTQYDHGDLFTTVADRAPVLVRAYNEKRELIKEIYFDKLDQAAKTWVIRQLTVVDKKFDYTSTFNFENVQINSPLDDAIFTSEFLKKGWTEADEKASQR